ncbi:MAG: hypothetical protein WBQ08_06225 [Candidatus Sulfotelmatobacter sp.]
MRQRSSIPVAAAIIVTTLLAPMARAQAPTLQEQLIAQYKLVKMGSDTSGYSVVEKGTLLEIKKGGILGVPYGDNNVPASHYENGAVKGPSGLALMGRKSIMGKFGKEQTTHLFASGDKVYPMKVEVNVAKDTVTLGIVACDTCNKTDPPTYNKAQVVFQFPKGSLAAGNASGVEDTIGQLLAVTDDTQQDQGQQGGQQDQGQQDQGQQAQQGGQGGGGQQGGQDQPQQADPQTIQLGQTTDQVQAALGKPDKIVNLGPKQIWVYKDLKVTFKDGKVSDVQ